jgi:hypothetical protein
MARRHEATTDTRRARRTAGWLAIASLALVATGASAAKVSEVRVGTHDQHTRIVLELDAATGYRLSTPQPGARPELVVTLDAESAARDVPSKSPLVRKVHVEPSADGSVVRIRLATAEVSVKEMLLANPPRLVFDLAANGPIPKPTADELAEEAKELAPPAASGAIAAVPPPAPAKADEPKPAEPKVEPTKASAPITVAALEPAKQEPPAAAPQAAEPIAPPVAKPAPLASAPAPSAPATDPLASPSAAPAPIAKPAPPLAKPATADAETRRKTIAAKAQAETQPAASGESFFTSTTGMAVIGGAVLLVLAIVVMRRRRAAQDEDPLYTVMAAEDASRVAGDVEAPAEAPRTIAPSWDSFEASEPALRDGPGPRQLALGSRSETEPAPAPSPLSFAPEPIDPEPGSIFGSDPEPEPLPAAAPTTAPVAPSHAAPASMSGEMERRIEEMERRIEQLVEARERLERQVAAQTEELRVQRAAIARTQRVVRSIAKTEDMATEPVPRAPSAS